MMQRPEIIFDTKITKLIHTTVEKVCYHGITIFVDGEITLLNINRECKQLKELLNKKGYNYFLVNNIKFYNKVILKIDKSLRP